MWSCKEKKPLGLNLKLTLDNLELIMESKTKKKVLRNHVEGCHMVVNIVKRSLLKNYDLKPIQTKNITDKKVC